MGALAEKRQRPLQPSGPAAIRLVRALAALTLFGGFLYLVVHTWRWPLMQDAPVIHYVNFLTDHGFAPYRTISDMNMPGAYMMERAGVFFFGAGDLGFRLYDFSLMAIALAGMIAIAWPHDWLAGLFAGVLFAAIHAADGPKGAGQRDEVMAALAVAGLAFMFHSVRRLRPHWMLASGFLFGMAAAVKPTIAPLGLVLLVLIAIDLRRRRTRWLPFAGYGALGGAVPAALFLGFLLHYRAVHAFIFLTRNVTAYYAGVNHVPFIGLLRESFPRPMRLIVLLGLICAVLNPDRRSWERWALALATAFGAVSYFAQGKGFYYQRYPLIAMTLLWFGIELALAARRRGVARLMGTAGLAFGIFVLVPLFAERARTVFFSNAFTTTLEADLKNIGVDRLQRHVECLDMVDGCMNALYHLGIVQQTGMTGDNLLFAPESASSTFAVEYYRRQFWDGLVADPPDVFVLSDEKFLDPASFDKLDRWPQFERYLADNYELVAAHSFSNITVAYRIYRRKGSSE